MWGPISVDKRMGLIDTSGFIRSKEQNGVCDLMDHCRGIRWHTGFGANRRTAKRMTSKKPSTEATTDQASSRRNRTKTVCRSLIEASEAQKEALLARELRTSQTQQELAVLVVVEFTRELRKRKLTAAARLARTTATVIVGEEELAVHAAATLV